MECGEIREILAAYHDGELAPADRARVEEHLRGCEECSAILARLGEIDADVRVPDPGAEYWERFNRRVMERVKNGADVPGKTLRPERGWARRRLPYFLPAVAAAALLLVIVRQTGMDPFSRTSAPPSAPQAVVKEEAKEALSPPPAPKARINARRAAPEESPPAASPEAGSRYDASASGKPQPVPRARVAPERSEAEKRAARVPEGGAASRVGGATEAIPIARDREAREIMEGRAARAVPKPLASAAPDAVPSQCETARSLAGQRRYREAEAAQRACLARENRPAAQERGMVFLAELLDRQSRFAEADTVLEEARRRFPGSRLVSDYLQQRSRVGNPGVPAER